MEETKAPQTTQGAALTQEQVQSELVQMCTALKGDGYKVSVEIYKTTTPKIIISYSKGDEKGKIEVAL